MLDLMAIVSHELKSPLAAVQTTASTLHRGYFGKLEPEQQKIVETIIRNCSYLEDIIRSYIDLSKMELDGLATFKERVPFASAVVAEALDMPGVRDNVRRMPIVDGIRRRSRHRRRSRPPEDPRREPGQQRHQVRGRRDAGPPQAGPEGRRAPLLGP